MTKVVNRQRQSCLNLPGGVSAKAITQINQTNTGTVIAPASHILLVSCCDKLHNARSIVADLRDIGEAIWARFAGQKDGTLWYYRTLVSAFRDGPHHRLVDELDRTVSAIEKLASD